MPELTVDQAFALAAQYHQAGQVAEAVALYQQILRINPHHDDALHALGLAAFQAGQPQQALDLIDRSLAFQPHVAIRHNNRGQALQALGRFGEAGAAYRQAIKLDPNYPEPRNNLGVLHERKIELQDAADCYAAALRLRPNYAEVHSNLGNVLKEQGQVALAAAAQRRATELRPDMPLIHSNLLLTLHYLAEISPGELAAEHRTWRERHSDPLITHRMTLHRTRESERRLRVGYVSPDFRDHPIVRFITPLLAAHDRGQTEAICYADHGVDDPVTAEVEKLSDAWHRVGSLTDEQLATRVRDDGIDILVDLAGHTSRGRLRAFALKPAPVQVTYLGYPNTTGLDTIDYRLVDAWSDPPGLTDPYCTEKLWRLPRTAWCYRPPNHAAVPAVSSRLARGEFHFGSFNTLAKLSPVTLELWADVLRAIPRAKLVLKAKALTDKPGRRATAAQFARLGIDPSRLIFLPWARTAGDHLAAYENIDVALDSFPYHGTTTTCDALWMGVPVVTLAGEMHHSRVGVSLLQNAGQADCIATSRADFVQRAVSLVQEPEKLAARRKELRAQMAASPLRDEAGFARDFEAALRAMWRTYCQSPAS